MHINDRLPLSMTIPMWGIKECISNGLLIPPCQLRCNINVLF
jgi:hypothetical protein